jgi:cell division protease FtsH
LGRREPSSGGPRWRRASKTLAFWAFFILLVAVFVPRFFDSVRSAPVISYKRFQELLEAGRIVDAEVVDTTFRGTLDLPEELELGSGILSDRFVVNVGSIDAEDKREWTEAGVDFRFQKKVNWGGMVFSFLPWILIAAIWLFILRQVQSGPKGVFSFGKSRARLLTEERPKVSFTDCGGVDEAKQELEEIIEFLKDPARFQKLGGRIPKGVLLVGPPGTGKTHLARAVAGEADVPFFFISGSDFVEMFVGVGASRVRDLFVQAKQQAPCLVLVDEIDAVGRLRGAGIGGGHDEREQTLNQLLVEMDGFESNEGVIMLAATNRPDVLDPALLRPGRFDRQIVVERPDVRGREQILRIHTREMPLARAVRLDVLARGTPGLTGADLANMVNEAALIASRRKRRVISMKDFEEAKDKVMMGAERRSLVINDEERRSLAYHEGGHALVGKLVPEADPVYKVMIVPRGRALGVTLSLPIDDRHLYSKTWLEGYLATALGGRAAEMIVLGQTSTGAADDLEKATQLARKMVCEWGMSERLGPLAYGHKDEEVFLGRELAVHRDYSERTAVLIDEEVKKIVIGAQKRAEQLLRENSDKLEALANALLEHEVLDSDQIDRVLGSGVIPTKRRPRRRKASRPARGEAPAKESTPAVGEPRPTAPEVAVGHTAHGK